MYFINLFQFDCNSMINWQHFPPICNAHPKSIHTSKTMLAQTKAQCQWYDSIVFCCDVCVIVPHLLYVCACVCGCCCGPNWKLLANIKLSQTHSHTNNSSKWHKHSHTNSLQLAVFRLSFLIFILDFSLNFFFYAVVGFVGVRFVLLRCFGRQLWRWERISYAIDFLANFLAISKSTFAANVMLTWTKLLAKRREMHSRN